MNTPEARRRRVARAIETVLVAVAVASTMVLLGAGSAAANDGYNGTLVQNNQKTAWEYIFGSQPFFGNTKCEPISTALQNGSFGASERKQIEADFQRCQNTGPEHFKRR